jgi:methylphosphotriester-DNA--protein-cysteine methyltransferase
MDYREIRPSPRLAPFVSRFWLLRGPAESVAPMPQRVLPDGCLESIFHLGRPFRRQTTDGAWRTQPEAFLVGQITGPLLLAPAGEVDVVGIRWRPAGAHAFLRRPLSELTDREVALADLDAGSPDLLERLRADARAEARARVLEDWLWEGLASAPAGDGRVDLAVRLLLASGGRLPVSAVADRLGTSVRQLQRSFRERVGVGPKFLARLVRFQRFVRALPRASADGVAALALAAGYFDQAHLIREFRALAGETPGRFATESHELSDLLTGRRPASAPEPLPDPAPDE